MKKVMVALLLVVGLTTYAQEEQKQDGKREGKERFSPEQRNQLILKKLTLDLGLNDSQQKEMSKIISEQTAKREAAMAQRKATREKGMKASADERFAKANQRLDDEMAMKTRIQKILTPDQFKKWEDRKKDRQEHREKRMEKRAAENQKTEE